MNRESDIFDRAFGAAQHRLDSADPLVAGIVASANPNSETFSATVSWPTDNDPWSQVAVRVNHPYDTARHDAVVGVSFVTHAHEGSTIRRTSLDIHLGAGRQALGASTVVEEIDNGTGQEQEPIRRPATPETAADHLAQFGISSRE